MSCHRRTLQQLWPFLSMVTSTMGSNLDATAYYGSVDDAMRLVLGALLPLS